MSTRTVVAVYDSTSRAEHAVRTLQRNAFPMKLVSIVAHALYSDRDIHGCIMLDEPPSDSGAVTGNWTGGVFKLLAGAGFIWAPGFGELLVAGPAAAILFNLMENEGSGPAASGPLGALLAWAVPAGRIPYYQHKLRDGRLLVIARGDSAEAANAMSILRGTPLEEVFVYSENDPEDSPITEPLSTTVSNH